MSWRQGLDSGHPCWSAYRESFEALPDQAFPAPSELAGLLPPEAVTARGIPVRFVASGELAEEDYESRIYRSGEISTRLENLHDLFNALAWINFPRSKSALNALHHAHREAGDRGSRGHARDALTLFDEGGAIVLASEAEALQAVARHDWPIVFAGGAAPGPGRLRLMLLGHGLLEKCLSPYKSMTANALLLRVPGHWLRCSEAELKPRVDGAAAALMLNEQALASPAGLSPLPLMGLPGWWPGGRDAGFYADRAVFRPLPPGRAPAPVHSVATT